jgi:preprotein translocase subunit SecB
MKSNDVLSELIFLGSRVVVFNLITNMVSIRNQPVNVSFDFDYKIKDVEREENRSLCLIDYSVKVKATIKKKVLFKIELVTEGAFRSDTLADDKFKELVEVNGLITLSHISRAYIQSVTAQSGINPPVRVPMININTLIEKKEKKAVPPEK